MRRPSSAAIQKVPAALLSRSPAGALQTPVRTMGIPPVVHDVLSSPGQPLDSQTRNFMEPRFHHDFSSVRVHTNDRAAESAAAAGANAYAVGPNLVFGAGQYAPGTSAGRRLIAHELVHTVQQSGGGSSGRIPVGKPGDPYEQEAEHASESALAGRGFLPPISLARGFALQRQSASGDSDTIVMAPGEDLSAKNPKLRSIASKASQVLSDSPKARVVISSLWSSAGTDDLQKSGLQREAARTKGNDIRIALINLGIPGSSISVNAPDLNEDGAGSGAPGQILVGVIASPVVLPQPKYILPPAPVPKPGGPAAAAPAQSVQVLDIDKNDDVTEKNFRIGEAARNLVVQMKDPGGIVDVTAWMAEPKVPLSDEAVKERTNADTRAQTVVSTLGRFNVNSAFVHAGVKFAPAGDARIGHVVIAFTPTVVKPKEEDSLDFSKFTTIEFKKDNFQLSIKIPKSIEAKVLRHKQLSFKLSVPKGVSVSYKPIRGVPGLEIGVSGEITKLGDLLKKPDPPKPGKDGFTNAPAGPPVKFNLSIAFNGKGFKIEATSEVNLNTRAVTGGLSFTIIESGVQYQIPSSVYDDINKAGAQLQKALNALMGVQDQPAGTAAVGSTPPAPAPVASPDPLSNLADVADALSTIADSMDKISKAKDEKAQPKLKFGPTITVPFGPSREGTPDAPLGNKPIYGGGFTYTF